MSLQRYVLKRVLVTIPILIGATMLTFGLVALTPGDPVDYIIAFQDVSPEVEQQLREQYGLDKPLFMQYLDWLAGVVQFDFGDSISNQRPVTELIMERLPYTLLMGSMAFMVTLITAIPTGIIAAYYRGSVIDQASRVFSVVGIAIPNFFLGILLLLIFASQLNIFPFLAPSSGGALTPEMAVYTLLPAITIGTGATALLMRLMRSSMIEELDKDYVTMARAKGLPERTVVNKHVLRNSLISVVTVAAIQVAFIISGSVVVEIVFSYPGIGRLLVNSVGARDFPVIQALVLLIGVAVILANLLADILYAYLDPRIRY
ncbi:ABC transporter permease subunit [Halovenus sp. WSH3]|uniref:ABC transporter permease subunit n=1 Tax=Halovenus carboxidivorans TaxID=2692199 RepID=A0A6B0TAC9_9EURY|nr:ABC transporter permease [Halovenus carboxidivorans]MXR52201.1 ABC transporter permease subunit [Halovenus carboxidivorans]